MSYQTEILNSTKEEIKSILENTKTIALVGCSPDEEKPSHIVAKYLIENGYTLFPIYPKEEMILGQKVYRNLLDIPFQIDLVNIFRKSRVIAQVVDSAIKRGDVKYIWSQLDLVNNEAMQKALQYNMKVVQNYCTKIEHQKLSITYL